jgi:hypothetical protein
MAIKAGVGCKSYALPGIDGGELVVSEVIDRSSIEITLRQSGNRNLTDSLSVRLNAAQFAAICNLGSAYDGLEVRTPPPMEVEEDIEVAQSE